jgi:hypothetical protein
VLVDAAGFAPVVRSETLPIVNASLDGGSNGWSEHEVRAPRADVVFVDGFEAGSACRWSGSGPCSASGPRRAEPARDSARIVPSNQRG